MRAGRDQQISPGQFWIYECWTSNTERGRGIYPAVLSRVVRDHIEQGLQEGVIYTTPQNVPSQRGILKAGFHHEGTLRSIRLGRIYIPI
jgi:RimJ/RimL family protein N-acetyltransferase